MKNILVPTDFSDCALNALKTAAQLAKKHNIVIHLLHLLDLPSHNINSSGSEKNIPEAIFFMKNAHNKFKTLITSPFLKDIKIKEATYFKSISQGILKYTKENNIDYIIMGSHGATGISEILIGSNTEKIVRLSKTPVIVIKEETDISNFKQVAFACNLKEENINVANQLSSFSEKLNLKINLIYINTPQKFKTTIEIENKIKNFLKNVTLKNYSLTIYNDTSVEKGILNFCNETNSDLICIGAHKHYGVFHFVSENITDSLVNHSKKPIITFNIKK